MNTCLLWKGTQLQGSHGPLWSIVDVDQRPLSKRNSPGTAGLGVERAWLRRAWGAGRALGSSFLRRELRPRAEKGRFKGSQQIAGRTRSGPRHLGSAQPCPPPPTVLVKDQVGCCPSLLQASIPPGFDGGTHSWVWAWLLEQSITSPQNFSSGSPRQRLNST